MRFRMMVAVAAILCSCAVKAQDEDLRKIKEGRNRKQEEDTTHKSGWKKAAILSLNLAQGSSNNWVSGAEKFSFSTSLSVELFANLKRDKLYWNNSLGLGYAIVNTTSQGIRKTDDRIDLYTKVGYKIEPAFYTNIFRNGFGEAG